MVLQYSSFSSCGNYYAHCGNDGKLKVWETSTGALKQEYTPNLHLTSPYTCLTWIASANVQSQQKKKRKSDGGEGGSPQVVLGTQAGNVVVYSLSEGGIISSLNDGHKSSVLCLAWTKHAGLFTCSVDNFVQWDVKHKTVKSKWKNGEVCSALAVSEDGESLISAARTIKWWNVAEKTVVKTFTGHSTPVFSLSFICSSADSYVISAAQNDRLLNAWCLNKTAESTAVSSFLMSDLAESVSVNVSKEDATNIAVVTQSGTLHLYSHQINGKRGKPLKPKLTVLIAADTGQNKSKVAALSIVAVNLHSNLRAHIVYGQAPFFAFETLKLEHSSNEMCLVRKEPKINLTTKQESVTKVRVPEVSKDVSYMSGLVMNGSGSASKRGRGKESEVPMEERLENLALNQPSSSAQPKAEGMTHLLLQGLQSKDKSLLQNVLFRRDEAVIAQTVQRLPVQAITPLVKELTVLLQGKTFTNQIAAVWLKALLAAHAGQLLADPGTLAEFSPLLGLVETRLGCMAPLTRLRGRLDLVLHQLTDTQRQTASLDTQPLLVHQDQDSTEEGSDTFGSEGEDDDEEDRWDELSDDEMEADQMESEDVSSS